MYFRVSGGIAAVPVNVQGDSLSFGASTRVAAVASGTWLGRQVGRRELLRDYDVGPDGRLIVVRDASLTGDIEAHAVMVYDWFDDVERRVAAGQ